MGTEDLHFENDSALYAFAGELRADFPAGCTDKLGNTCSSVAGQALEIATQVDLGDITEEQARERAILASNDIRENCRSGLSPTRVCGYGVLCTMGIRE